MTDMTETCLMRPLDLAAYGKQLSTQKLTLSVLLEKPILVTFAKEAAVGMQAW